VPPRAYTGDHPNHKDRYQPSKFSQRKKPSMEKEFMKKTNDNDKPRKPHVIHPTPAEVLNMKASKAPTLA